MALLLRDPMLRPDPARNCRPAHRIFQPWAVHPTTRTRAPETWRVDVVTPKFQRLRSHALEEEIDASRYIYSLQDDWDDAGSPGVSRSTWQRAIDFLRLHDRIARRTTGEEMVVPEIGPGPDGGIDLFWSTKQFELLVFVPTDVAEPATFYGDDYGKQTIKGSLSTSEVTPGLLQWLIRR